MQCVDTVFGPQHAKPRGRMYVGSLLYVVRGFVCTYYIVYRLSAREDDERFDRKASELTTRP